VLLRCVLGFDARGPERKRNSEAAHHAPDPMSTLLPHVILSE
jgi:hypothetical protein